MMVFLAVSWSERKRLLTYDIGFFIIDPGQYGYPGTKGQRGEHGANGPNVSDKNHTFLFYFPGISVADLW